VHVERVNEKYYVRLFLLK